jgi:hypothetical protein
VSPDTAPPPDAPLITQVHEAIIKDGTGAPEVHLLVNWVVDSKADIKDYNNWVAHLTINDTTIAMSLVAFLKLAEEIKLVFEVAKRDGLIA